MRGDSDLHGRYLAGILVLTLVCAVDSVADAQDAATSRDAPLGYDSPADDAIRKALEKKANVDFAEVPLAQVIDSLASDHSISVLLDKKALDDAGVGTDTPITFKLSGASLRSVLKGMLKELDLTWVISDGVLTVTTVDEAGQRLTTRVQDVTDLLTPRKAESEVVTIPVENLEKPLIDTIQAIVAPTTWDDVGGPGSAKLFNGMLVLSQTDEVHEEIAKLLGELRKVQARREAKPKTPADSGKRETGDPKALQLRIYRIGERGNNFEFGVSSIPVVGSVEQPSQPIAKPGDRVAPLAQFGGGAPVQRPATTATAPGRFEVVKELAEVIPAMIEPQSWLGAGGTGTIRALPIGGSTAFGTMLVRQTPAVHARIVQLLMQLDAAGGLAQITTDRPRAPVSGGGNFF
jgi:hypothetical protein